MSKIWWCPTIGGFTLPAFSLILHVHVISEQAYAFECHANTRQAVFGLHVSFVFCMANKSFTCICMHSWAFKDYTCATIDYVTDFLTENVPSNLRPGGRKRVNELCLGGRILTSNIVRWDAIHHWIASYSVECCPLRMRNKLLLYITLLADSYQISCWILSLMLLLSYFCKYYQTIIICKQNWKLYWSISCSSYHSLADILPRLGIGVDIAIWELRILSHFGYNWWTMALTSLLLYSSYVTTHVLVGQSVKFFGRFLP